MKKFLVLLITSIILFSSCQSTKYVAAITTDDNTEHINLDYKKKLFFVDLLVNGKPTKFLIDTGASISLLDIRQAEKFGFICRTNGNRVVTGINGRLLQYSIDRIDISSHDGKSIPFRYQACDLSNVVKAMSRDGIDIVGVLGSDFLMHNNAVINYKTKTLDLFYK